MFSRVRNSLAAYPLDRLLHSCKPLEKPRLLIYWNRGLGDIPLGLYALCVHIRKILPSATISFLTRRDLAEAFTMLEQVEVLVDPDMERGKPFSIQASLTRLGAGAFDLILEKIDATKWLRWQIGKITPRLQWNLSWEKDIASFALDKEYLGVHVSSETSQFYGYEKNWSQESFQKLFCTIKGKQKVLLFGFNAEPRFEGDHIIDLRGKTSLYAMLAIIKNHCSHLLAPDSGVLSVVYYIDEQFPLRVVSLWSDPRQGILRQKVASPNKSLIHLPLIGFGEAAKNISVEQVVKALYC